MKRQISIEGMSCQNCVRHVKEALEELAPGAAVTVDLEGKKADFAWEKDLSDDAIKEAVEDAGYTVTGIAAG